MGFISKLFGKPSKEEILRFNYHVNFKTLPDIVEKYNNKQLRYSDLMRPTVFIGRAETQNCLAKKISVVDTGINNHPNLKMILVKTPSNGSISEVAAAIIMVDTVKQKAILYTMEYSLGGYAICLPESNGNHTNTGIMVKNGDQFAAYVLKVTYHKQTEEMLANRESMSAGCASLETKEPQSFDATTGKKVMPHFEPVARQTKESTSSSNNQEYEILSPYFPKHLDNDKYRQARKTKTGANFILAGLQSYIAQMEASFPEWKGLFTIRANGEIIEVTVIKGFQHEISIKALNCLWRRKTFLENCMLLGVKKIVFVNPIDKTFDLLEINKFNPQNYQ